jgi:hypothetical protein
VREAIGLVVSLANELIKVGNFLGLNNQLLPNPAPSAQVPKNPSGGFGGGGFGSLPKANTTINNITVNAIDGEGAARAVAKVVNQSAARSTPALSYQAIRAAAG